MEEKMAKAEISGRVIGPTKEEVESLTGKGAKEGLVPWISPRTKAAIGAVVGLGCTTCSGAVIWELTHQRPAIIEPASAAQIPPAPEIGVLPEVRTAPEYIERTAIEVEEKVPSPEKKVATEANFFYEVKEGDSLSSIGQKFGVDWHQVAEANKIARPDFIIHPEEILEIPLTGIFVPAIENFVPSESILLRTAEEVNLGINFLNNAILPAYGLNELALPLVNPQEDIQFLPYVGEGKEAPAASAGGKISLYVPDIGEIAWIEEELAIDHSRQDPIHRRREIWKILHEDVHLVQRGFEYAGEFYEKDEDLTEALENMTEYIAFVGTTPYREKEDGWGSVEEGTLAGTVWRIRQVEAWIEKLNESGLDGFALILEYGLKGDMRGFEKTYDSYVGSGAFRSTVLLKP